MSGNKINQTITEGDLTQKIAEAVTRRGQEIKIDFGQIRGTITIVSAKYDLNNGWTFQLAPKEAN